MHRPAILATALAAVAAFVASSAPCVTTPGPVAEKQRGVSWVAGRQVEGAQFDALVKLGANWIVQEPFGWQPDPAAPEIVISTTSAHSFWGESDEGIRVTTRLAHDRGIHTLLKPHLWVKGGGWVGDIRMKDDRAWAKWFENYRAFILHYATLAEQNGIEALCVGTELRNASVEHPDRWRALIREIRTVYHGRLTYAANWDREYDKIAFWDALDFIGVQAYFPLAKGPRPAVEELLEGWKPNVEALGAVSRRFSKPVVFTEIGYRSTANAAIEPWTWPGKEDGAQPVPDNPTQARCFEAFFRALWDKEWFGGAYVWKWYPHGAGAGREKESDFTPQGKPAEDVIRSWYAKGR